MNSLENIDAKNPSLVAEWYCSVINNSGFHVAFLMSDLKRVDEYCEKVLWSKEDNSENSFLDRCGLAAYIGETLVRNFQAKWIGEFNLYGKLDNYYFSFIRFPNGYRIAPERIVAPRLVNKRAGSPIEENVNEVIEYSKKER